MMQMNRVIAFTMLLLAVVVAGCGDGRWISGKTNRQMRDYIRLSSKLMRIGEVQSYATVAALAYPMSDTARMLLEAACVESELILQGRR